jgi:hypothetical protein
MKNSEVVKVNPGRNGWHFAHWLVATGMAVATDGFGSGWKNRLRAADAQSVRGVYPAHRFPYLASIS